MIFVVEMLLISCSKSKKVQESEPPAKNFKFEVIEYQTNVPISSAKLEFSYRTPAKFRTGCSSIRTVF